LCSWVHGRFAEDEHEILIRQLYKIKQSRLVQEYIDKFVELLDQLKAYSNSIDPLYYTKKVVDGLKDEIKQSIIVQRPKDLDTTCCFALLQEENTLSMKEVEKFEGGYQVNPYFKGPLPLPLPKPSLQVKQDNIQEEKNKPAVGKCQPIEEKMAALSTYRMVRGFAGSVVKNGSRVTSVLTQFN
jgi:hypothetical protein